MIPVRTHGPASPGNPRLGHAALALALAFLLAAPLGGCEGGLFNRRARKEAKERRERLAEAERAAAAERRGLEPGESVVVEFEGDGDWHPLPYALYRGEVVSIEAEGDSRRIAPSAVEYKIGKLPGHLSDQSRFLVTDPGALSFRLDSAKAGTYAGGKVQVRVTRTQ